MRLGKLLGIRQLMNTSEKMSSLKKSLLSRIDTYESRLNSARQAKEHGWWRPHHKVRAFFNHFPTVLRAKKAKLETTYDRLNRHCTDAEIKFTSRPFANEQRDMELFMPHTIMFPRSKCASLVKESDDLERELTPLYQPPACNV